MKKIFFYISEIFLPSKIEPHKYLKCVMLQMNYSVSLFTFNNKLSPKILKNYNIKKIKILNHKNKVEINFFIGYCFQFLLKHLKKQLCDLWKEFVIIFFYLF